MKVLQLMQGLPLARRNSMHYLYALKSAKTNRIYIGQSNDFKRRLREHNRGYVKSTRKNCPWKIIALQKFDNINYARWKERQLKKSKGLREQWLIKYAYGSESEVSK